MNVFDLAAVLTLNKSDYDKGLGDAEKEASGFGSKLKSAFGTVSKVGGATIAAIGTVATATTKKLLDSSSQVAQLGDHIDKQSQKIGISAKAYQEWDFILTHNGASVDSLQASMKTLSTQAEKNADEFAALGISQEELANMGTEELFERVVKGLQGMEQGTERTAIASKLLGRGATELAPVLNSTSDDIEDLRQQAHDLGKVMSDEAVKSGAAYEDSLYNLQSALGGIKNKMASDFLPGLVSVMDGLTGLLSGDDSAVDKISEAVEGLAGKIGDAIPRIAESAMKILPAITNAISKNVRPLVNGAIKLVTNMVREMPKIIQPVIRMLPSAITDIAQGIAENAPELIKGVIEMITMLCKELPNILVAIAQALPDILSGIFHGLIDNLPELIAGVVELVAGLIENLPEILGGIVTKVGEMFGEILTNLLPFGDDLKAIFKGFDFGGFVGNLFGEVRDIIKGIFDFIGKLFDDPAQAIKDAISGVKDFAVKTFESVKQIITGIFDLIKAKQEEAEAIELNKKVKSQEERLILQGIRPMVEGAKYSDEFYEELANKRALYGEGFGTTDYVNARRVSAVPTTNKPAMEVNQIIGGEIDIVGIDKDDAETFKKAYKVVTQQVQYDMWMGKG